MASIRVLKKDINILTFDLLNECYTYKNSNEGLEDTKFDEVIKKIVYLRNDLILRTNHPESNADSPNLKDHFRKIREDLYELTRVIEELKNN